MLHSDFFRMDVVNANVAASINAGVSAVIRHYPDRDVNGVFLANTRLGVWEPRRAIHRLLVADEGPRA
jgi:hypothetical protein